MEEKERNESEELKIWSPGQQKNKPVMRHSAELPVIPEERPEVNVTDLYGVIRSIFVLSDINRLEPYLREYWREDWERLSDDDAEFCDRISCESEINEIENVEVLLRMLRLCPDYLDNDQIRRLKIAAAVKQVLDFNDIEIILSDLKKCERIIDPRMKSWQALDDELFRTLEQKCTMIQELNAADVFYHEAFESDPRDYGVGKECQYPDTYKLAFLHRSDKAEIEVWIELNLTYEWAYVSFYRR